MIRKLLCWLGCHDWRRVATPYTLELLRTVVKLSDLLQTREIKCRYCGKVKR